MSEPGDWLFDTSANKFNNTYFRDYYGVNNGIAVDISGDLVVRDKVGIGTSNPPTLLSLGYNLAADGSYNTGTRDLLQFQSYRHNGGFAIRNNDDNTYAKLEYIYSNWNNNHPPPYGISGGQQQANTSVMTLRHDGNVGIGTTDPVAKLHIQGGGAGTISAPTDSASGRRYWYGAPGSTYYENLGDNISLSKTLSLFCNSAGAMSELIIGPWMTFTSDRRIKQNIVEIIDDDALQKIRLLKPCTYNYKDYIDNGTNKVYGFIAQEVKEILPYAVNENTGPLSNIPNIYCSCDVSNNTTIKLLKDSHCYTDSSGTVFGKSGSLNDLEKDVSNNYFSLIFIDNNEQEIVKNIVNIVDDTTLVIDSPFNEEQLVDGKIFLLGQKASNFNYLNKNAIFTIATAALQEVDRQLQAEKAKTATLESQVAALLAKYPL